MQTQFLNFDKINIGQLPEWLTNVDDANLLCEVSNDWSVDDYPPDDCIDNGINYLYRYDLIDYSIVIDYNGNIDTVKIIPIDATWADYFNHWDFGDVNYYEGINEFGLDIVPPEAEESDVDVKIWCKYHYYQGQNNAPSNSYLYDDEARDWQRDPLVFKTYEEAKDKIEELDAKIYYLANGEYGRPDYLIVK